MTKKTGNSRKKYGKHHKPPDGQRCVYTTPDGRRCTQFRAEQHASLCLSHWRRDRQLSVEPDPDADEIVAQVLGSRNKLRTKVAVNDAISKLFSLRSRKLVSARDTAVLGYLLQLSLQTLNGVDYEFNRIHDSAVWNNVLEQAIQDACGPDAPELQVQPEPVSRRKRRRKLPKTAKEFAAMVLDQAVKDGVITQELLDRDKRRRQGAPPEAANEEDNETREEDQEYVAPGSRGSQQSGSAGGSYTA